MKSFGHIKLVLLVVNGLKHSAMKIRVPDASLRENLRLTSVLSVDNNTLPMIRLSNALIVELLT